MRTASTLLLALTLVTVLDVEAQVRSTYWVEEDRQIFRLVLGDNEKENIFSDTTAHITALAVDSVSGKLFWLDPLKQDVNVFRADLDGQNVESILRAECGIGVATDLVVDSYKSKIYWGVASDCQGFVGRANLDGSAQETVFPGMFPFEPRRLALDEDALRLYWTDSIHLFDRDGNLIRDAAIVRASLGGTDLEVVAEFLPADIALDLVAEKLYWVTGGTASGGVIRRSNLDGTGVETVLEQLDRPVDIALDVEDGWMYWVERDAGAIRRARLDGTNEQEVISQLNEPSRLALSFENSGTSVGVIPQKRPGDGGARLEVYPNPSTFGTSVSVEIFEPSFVDLRVYDMLGRRISVLLSEMMWPGEHRATWDSRSVPSGVYLIALRVGPRLETIKLVVQ